MQNVLSNAIKYTPDGGSITVSVQVDGSFADLIVEDKGIGIDPEEHLLIFEQFYTAGNTDLHSTSKSSFKGGGLGLGLAIAKGVVDAHNGKIWVESSGRDERKLPGSRFHLLLPIHASTPAVQSSVSSVPSRSNASV